MTTETVIFLGPSLRQEQAHAIVSNAHFLPPARQGDIYRAVRMLHPRRIGLIDGAFLSVPSVWHREILWALAKGVQVCGAASMGALRAAELSDYGMVGIGKIFAAYREGRYPPFADAFEDDDEVAVIHAPPEVGGKPLCDAMVDLRETLAAAEDASLLDRRARDDLVRSMKDLHFTQRSFVALANAARRLLCPYAAGNLDKWLQDHQISQKARDASELLRVIADGVPASLPPPFRFERALVWERFIAAEIQCQIGDEERAVLVELGLDPAARHRTARRVLGRLAQNDVARHQLPASLDRFRRSRGLTTRAALDTWLADNAVTVAELERLLDEEDVLDETLNAMPSERLHRAMVDQLRLDGDFAPLLARVREKRRTVENHPVVTSGPAADAALAWYFEERLRIPAPASLSEHARAVGFEGEIAFRTAVWRQYLYLTANTRKP